MVYFSMEEALLRIEIVNLNHKAPVGHGLTRFRVCRPETLGNSFVIGKHGDRAAVIAQNRRWLWAKIKAKDPAIMAALYKIVDTARATAGVELACYCAPAACHAETIAAAVRWLASCDHRRAA